LNARMVKYEELPELELQVDLTRCPADIFEEVRDKLLELTRTIISDKTNKRQLFLRNPRPINSDVPERDTIIKISQVVQSIKFQKDEIISELKRAFSMTAPREFAPETYGWSKVAQPNFEAREEMRGDCAYSGAFRY
jgi:hypothetical protein